MDAWRTALAEVEGFDWDSGNDRKNLDKHLVSCEEAEQVFRNRPLLLREDAEHSQRESRCRALGRTDGGRRLRLAFTIRGKAIRVINARDMNRKERKAYEQD